MHWKGSEVMKVMKVMKGILKGKCGKEVKFSIWRAGHSFRCEGVKSTIRYWKPSTIEEELADFCKYCKEAEP
jgi:hypothetical protein